MYLMSEKRRIADWKKTLVRAKNRGFYRCKNCSVAWTPIYLSKLPKGQWKNTCSVECTKSLQAKNGSRSMQKLWENKEKMISLSSKGGRKSARTRTKRSKDEVKLYKLCKQHFKNVSHNEVIIDGWDADILLKEEKVAILWNGPWHYKKMPLSNHSLSQVQKRDEIKINRFRSLGWRVKVFEDRYYTPEDAIKELLSECAVV